MATLLRLGPRIINMDLVFEIEDYGDRLRLFYAATSSDQAGAQQPTYSDIDGAAAEALRTWLARNAEVLAPQADAEPASDRRTREEAQLYQAATHPETINNVPSDNSSFFGTARTRQLHGVGSEPPPETMDDEHASSS
jgi:hypothetical protein